MTANTRVWVKMAERLVSPDLKKPLLPGGMVKRIPGLNKRKRTVGTIKSVLTILIPRAFAMAQYDAIKRRA